jgi:L-amino acid N-acyltransferase YncA
MIVRSISEASYPDVARIYEEGIVTGVATFETEAKDWAEWDKSHFQFGRIIACEDEYVLGWAGLSPVSSRCVYGGVAEVSVYVAADARGKGVGKYLLNQLIKGSEENNIWTLQSRVFRENIRSIALHEKCGFRIIGYKERIGKLHGQWMENVLLERRSNVVGI